MEKIIEFIPIENRAFTLCSLSMVSKEYRKVFGKHEMFARVNRCRKNPCIIYTQPKNLDILWGLRKTLVSVNVQKLAHWVVRYVSDNRLLDFFIGIFNENKEKMLYVLIAIGKIPWSYKIVSKLRLGSDLAPYFDTYLPRVWMGKNRHYIEEMIKCNVDAEEFLGVLDEYMNLPGFKDFVLSAFGKNYVIDNNRIGNFDIKASVDSLEKQYVTGEITLQEFKNKCIVPLQIMFGDTVFSSSVVYVSTPGSKIELKNLKYEDINIDIDEFMSEHDVFSNIVKYLPYRVLVDIYLHSQNVDLLKYIRLDCWRGDKKYIKLFLDNPGICKTILENHVDIIDYRWIGLVVMYALKYDEIPHNKHLVVDRVKYKTMIRMGYPMPHISKDNSYDSRVIFK